jgi:hypothetical protein
LNVRAGFGFSDGRGHVASHEVTNIEVHDWVLKLRIWILKSYWGLKRGSKGI